MRLSLGAVCAVAAAAIIATVAWGVNARADDAAKPAFHAVDSPGTYKSRNERCGAVLKPADIGDYKVLAITRDGSVVQSVNGATALLWLNDDRLVYSTSAIFGEGGIFVYNCKNNRTTTVNTHLQGDVFHLFGASSQTNPIIFFYVTPNISLPKGGWERYEVELDGNGLKQIE